MSSGHTLFTPAAVLPPWMEREKGDDTPWMPMVVRGAVEELRGWECMDSRSFSPTKLPRRAYFEWWEELDPKAKRVDALCGGQVLSYKNLPVSVILTGYITEWGSTQWGDQYLRVKLLNDADWEGMDRAGFFRSVDGSCE
ncbi:hypothetical protein CERSUDRAFT_99563 [Gelatoporia subvermispora B]|uniref:Uncharacterized protein n=1 Tax=Ceriporiopsis subvermispora (strain B) TaxID=914234 RepID=M2R2N3_CERS8|nr:hypothetical protein CERSUDRAFT_99563 [Gelatoporia subvermispora B]